MGNGFFNYKVFGADKTNILFLCCFGNKWYITWCLSSTNRSLSRKTMKMVLEKVSGGSVSTHAGLVFCHIENDFK